MKLVRRASTKEMQSGKKNYNVVHWYYIDSFKGDQNIQLVEDLLVSQYSSDGNIMVEDGCGSTFYININQVTQFKKDYKIAKKQILEKT